MRTENTLAFLNFVIQEMNGGNGMIISLSLFGPFFHIQRLNNTDIWYMRALCDLAIQQALFK